MHYKGEKKCIHNASYKKVLNKVLLNLLYYLTFRFIYTAIQNFGVVKFYFI